MVNHKSKYSFESTIYFYLEPEIIKENYKFTFSYNKTNIIPILDAVNEIISANWPNDKHIICSVNNDIPVKIPSHPYVLVNRSILCSCIIEVENNFLLESLAACHYANSKLIMYFMVNTAFVNYLDQIDTLTETLEVQILMDKTTFEQPLPISLKASKFDSDLLTVPKTLKDFIYSTNVQEKFFHLEERYVNMDMKLPNKNFLSNNFIIDVFLFVTALISVLVTTLAIYLLCKHKKLRMLVTSLALQQIKEVGAVTKQEDVTTACTCKIQFYIILMSSISNFWSSDFCSSTL